jgi:hypothetical protein
MVIRSEDGKPVTDDQLAEIRAKAEAIPGFTVPDNNPDKMWQERPFSTARPRTRRSGSCRTAWSTQRRPKKIDELRAIQAPTGVLYVGGNQRPGAGQHPQPVRQAAADAAVGHHHDHPDVPGLRLAGAADQGGGDERADGGLHAGHPDLDVRRRARLRAVQLHPAAAAGADDRPDHRGHLGLSTDYEVFLVSRMVEARERGMSTRRPSGSAPPPRVG